MNETEKPRTEHWVLKKEVNVSIIGALIVQAIMFGIAWGNIENRVSNVESKVGVFEKVPERLASIEATLLAIKERLDRDAR
jgi:hypothetical protein